MKIEPSSIHDEALKAARPQLEGLRKATNGFEAIFVKNLLTEMQKGTTLFGTGAGSGIYQDLMNQSLSETISKRGSLGISKMLFSQLSPRIVAQAEAKLRLEAAQDLTNRSR